jgi:chromate transporter
MPDRTRLKELALIFLRLGATSFGGPVAHLGYFRAEFVDRRCWLDEAAYADLVALCQFLPGPASSQVVFALGMQRAGVAGAMTAAASFMLPSTVLMILLGYGIGTLGDVQTASWLHGLKLAAAAVVAQAVWSMGRSLCPDRTRLTIATATAAVLIVHPGVISQIGLLALGATSGILIYKREISVPAGASDENQRGHLRAFTALLFFFLLLICLQPLAKATDSKAINVFAGFYRAGSLVFGGGHVVLPLLRAELVPRGWVSDDAFLAGYGAAQAIPGPLFTFSAYLGTLIDLGCPPWVAGCWCLGAIFLPAWLIIGGCLPFWRRLRQRRTGQAALRGANASVVGILLAALYSPVWTEGVKSVRDVAAVILLFGGLQWWKLPSWLIVALAVGIGVVLR